MMTDIAESFSISASFLIGPQCDIADHDHEVEFYTLVQHQELVCQILTIEWLGTQVVGLTGVTIGRGAIAGAGEVVRSTIPAKAMAVGIPARVIGNRDPESSGKPGNTGT